MGIVVENVHYFAHQTEILSDVSVDLKKENLTVLFGPNGCGKTTLLKVMAGILRPYAGSIKVGDKEVAGCSRRQLGQRMSYVPSHSPTVFSYPVKDFVVMGRVADKNIFYTPKKADWLDVAETLELLGIERLAQQEYGSLSTGEKQLALIARSLVKHTSILLLDEPVSNLDFYNQHKIFSLVRMLQQRGVMIVVSVHDPNLALKYADTIVAMEEGQVKKVLDRTDATFVEDFQQYLQQTYSSHIRIYQQNSGSYADINL